MSSLLLALHILAATVWVGGMFFAHQALRPAALALDPPIRLPLWRGVFRRFFPWVWACIVVLPVTGLAMIFMVYGGFGGVGAPVHIMLTLGLIMILIFLHVWFAPYKALCRCLDAGEIPLAGEQLAKIRRLVGINLVLGLIVVVVAAGGRFV